MRSNNDKNEVDYDDCFFVTVCSSDISYKIDTDILDGQMLMTIVNESIVNET